MPLVVLSALTFSGCARPETTSTWSQKNLTIAVIPKGTTHEFWKSIHAGSIKAAQALSTQGTQVELIWKGPLREDDREQQIQRCEAALQELRRQETMRGSIQSHNSKLERVSRSAALTA